MNFQSNQNIKDILLPLKVMWLAFIVGLFIINIFYIKSFGFSLHFSLERPAILIFPFSILCFVFNIFFHKKFDYFVKAVNTQSTPITKKLDPEEQGFFKFYPRYFIFSLIIWVTNELCVGISILCSLFTRNYFYLVSISVVVLLLNLFKFRPDYFKFYNQKMSHGK